MGSRRTPMKSPPGHGPTSGSTLAIRSRSRRCATRSQPIRSRSPDSTTSLAMRATSSPVREAPPTLFDSGGGTKEPDPSRPTSPAAGGPPSPARRASALAGGIAILGVAEHTAAIIDLDAQTLEVRGRGFVALRRDGRERRFEAGPPIDLDQLRRDEGAYQSMPPSDAHLPTNQRTPSSAISPLEEAENRRLDFDRALDRSDGGAALAALLTLDEQLTSWAADTLDSDALARARSIYRGMLVRLGEASQRGLADPNQVVAPFVELALRVRDEARREQR